MLATIASAALHGVQGRPVSVEVHVSSGLPSFTVVGLPDTSCREARDRVRAALLSSGFTWPMTRITVNLAPSGFRKVGAGLDLAVALGVLVASGQLQADVVRDVAAVGELGLDGSLRRVAGVLPLVGAVATPAVAVPHDAAAEAALVEGLVVRSAPDLRAAVAALRGEAPWPDPPPPNPVPPADPPVDLARIRGQHRGRRAAEIAAAGGHHLLLVGPPGAGKTMLAKALRGLLPPLEPQLALEVTTVHSAAGLALPGGGLIEQPPFRAPHHTSSTVSLIGGGTAWLRPGEISAAHGGVLFLDELGEFSASTLDALRQPLEDGVVRIARAVGATTHPARFLLVGAMNPCPCGERGDPARCRCPDHAVQRYQRRLSGPLLDRFDLRVHAERPSADALFGAPTGERSSVVAQRVSAARDRASARGHRSNVELSPAELDRCAPVSDAAAGVLSDAVRRGRVTARGVHRVRCVARTIADLAGTDGVSVDHFREALMLRDAVGPGAGEAADDAA